MPFSSLHVCLVKGFHPAFRPSVRTQAPNIPDNCDILLKQGAYNYQFLWVPDGTGVGQTAMIEGDKYQTANEYLVKVYDRPFGERYDHFVGFGIVYSGR